MNAMGMREPFLLTHEPRDGVLCWGGPEHGRVIAIEGDRSVYLFPVQRRLSVLDEIDPSNPLHFTVPTVSYDVERFAVPWSASFGEVWFVLVYPENKTRLLTNLTGTAKTVMWMASPSSSF